MTADDALYRFRLRALALATEIRSVRAACRAMGIHPSTYYRWRHAVDRFGLEMLQFDCFCIGRLSRTVARARNGRHEVYPAAGFAYGDAAPSSRFPESAA